MSNQVKKPAAEANFEQAMQRLEQIVEQMESGELPLEELIVRYEEGMKLVKVCQEKLETAERRIEVISNGASGKPQLTEFQAGAIASSSSPAKTEERSAEDVSLF